MRSSEVAPYRVAENLTLLVAMSAPFAVVALAALQADAGLLSLVGATFCAAVIVACLFRIRRQTQVATVFTVAGVVVEFGEAVLFASFASATTALAFNASPWLVYPAVALSLGAWDMGFLLARWSRVARVVNRGALVRSHLSELIVLLAGALVLMGLSVGWRPTLSWYWVAVFVIAALVALGAVSKHTRPRHRRRSRTR